MFWPPAVHSTTVFSEATRCRFASSSQAGWQTQGDLIQRKMGIQWSNIGDIMDIPNLMYIMEMLCDVISFVYNINQIFSISVFLINLYNQTWFGCCQHNMCQILVDVQAYFWDADLPFLVVRWLETTNEDRHIFRERLSSNQQRLRWSQPKKLPLFCPFLISGYEMKARGRRNKKNAVCQEDLETWMNQSNCIWGQIGFSQVHGDIV